MRVLRMLVVAVVCAGGALGIDAQVEGTATPAAVAPAQPVNRIPHISSGVMSRNRLTGKNPAYPTSARMKGIVGMVVLHVIVGADGRVESLEAISGPKELIGASIDAVRQWTYKPYLLNGQPTEVDTTVVVNFNIGTPQF